jgi:threonine dehydrogenase-like Zn-dependent dehydrogenase
MKRYYITGPETITAFDEPVPEPGSGEAQVKITYTAISPGSNVYAFRNAMTGIATGPQANNRQDCVYMGSGVVTALGDGVSELAVGDAVALSGNGHAEYVVLPANRVYKLPAGVDPRDASLAYLAGWAVSALHIGRYAMAENVVVVGLGLVGASAAMVADMAGARVVGIDVDPTRRVAAEALGFGLVAAPGDPRIRDYVGERGVDLVLETSGVWAGFRTGFELARDYSRIALMGIYRDLPSAETAVGLHQMLYSFPSKLHYQKIDIVGCGYDPETALPGSNFTFTRDSNFVYLLEQIGRGKLPIGRLVSQVFRPAEVQSVFERFVAGDKSLIGAVFDWTEGHR